ncbi:MAG: serine/threonine protein kinase, partial [Planctomycetales bacterium]|nr:serine/threonine protein kinase [Planctomycetales bacterium]
MPELAEQLQLHREIAEQRQQHAEHVRDTSENAERETLFAGSTQESNLLGAGTKLGNYKLLQLIGSGGMGAVWLAVQEQPIHRRVAVKVIKPGLDSTDVMKRFEAERQALAMMDHQNIAKVIDAGMSDDGRPYFSMELVQGVPITDYCDDHKLSLVERLQLFIPVCNAVQHAHQKGIIHRDLKPSNVLVTIADGEPVPKVIDFGLAKALQHQTKLSDKTIYTEFGQLLGTLQYMSPEQADMSAIDVDTRTDIYSLGVMLYELLTGSTPLSRETIKLQAFLQVLKLIKEDEPPRPSSRLSNSGAAVADISKRRNIAPAKLQQILRGDLDWIVMKAIEKDRNRRYATANDFGQDISRFLNDETVEARPPTAGYRICKFVKRNRSLVATMAAMLALVTSTLLISRQMVIKERDIAQARLAQLEKGNDILRFMFDSLDLQSIVEKDRPLETILTDCLIQVGNRLTGDSVGAPEDVASMKVRLSFALSSLGAEHDAAKLLEQALDTQEVTLGTNHQLTQVTKELLASVRQAI